MPYRLGQRGSDCKKSQTGTDVTPVSHTPAPGIMGRDRRVCAVWAMAIGVRFSVWLSADGHCDSNEAA